MTGGETSLCEKLTAVCTANVDDCELYTGFMCEYNVGNVGRVMHGDGARDGGEDAANVVAGDAFFQEDALRDESVMGGVVGGGSRSRQTS